LPFGEEIPASYGVRPAIGGYGATDGVKKRFTGKERDLESGLDYFGARHYQNQSGRFTSTDPVLDTEQALVDPQRWNRYTYVRNNPFRYVDPDGRVIETAWDVFNICTGLVSLGANVSAGNVGGAALDVAGLLIDAGAAVVPGVPGGASNTVKAWRMADNAQLGRTFERAVLEALGATKNTSGVSEIATRVTTIPDLPIGKFFGVTEIKNVQDLSFSKQLQAQFAAAQTAGLPFNLIVSTRTKHISARLRDIIESTKGKIYIYDEKAKKFVEAVFDEYGNVIR
jgi:RHS repeat-associated protein